MTAEEHQVGGFGSIVATVAGQGKNCYELFKADVVGMDDKFGQSGALWQLMEKFGLTAEHIVKRAIKLYKNYKNTMVSLQTS